MDKTNEKHFGLRVDGDILAKFRYVCGFEGRSANAQIIQLMLKFIADYEKEHGKIQLDWQINRNLPHIKTSLMCGRFKMLRNSNA